MYKKAFCILLTAISLYSCKKDENVHSEDSKLDLLQKEYNLVRQNTPSVLATKKFMTVDEFEKYLIDKRSKIQAYDNRKTLQNQSIIKPVPMASTNGTQVNLEYVGLDVINCSALIYSTYWKDNDFPSMYTLKWTHSNLTYQVFNIFTSMAYTGLTGGTTIYQQTLSLGSSDGYGDYIVAHGIYTEHYSIGVASYYLNFPFEIDAGYNYLSNTLNADIYFNTSI